MTDRQGIILSVVLSGANVNDHLMLVEALESIPAVRSGRRGRPRFRPLKLHGDKGYDYPAVWQELKQRGIEARIARRGVEDGSRLGKHRWVVERTLAWLSRFRRLRVRYEQSPDIHLAFTYLAAVLINQRFLNAP